MTRAAVGKHFRLINESLIVLSHRLSLSKEAFLADQTIQDHVAYRMLQLVESCFKMGLAILDVLNKECETYSGVFRALHRYGVISEELQSQMENLAKLRNRLVHVYWDIEPDEIYSSLHACLEPVREYAEIAAKFLGQSEP
jgi:uncharacterized protein YutE (UPF0331/DUF86 family)